jgi:Tfp pilus assembly protein PilO
MERRARLSLLLLDAVGAGVLTVAFFTACWLTFFHNQHAVAEEADLTHLLASATQDLATIRSALDRQHATLKERQAELAGRGQLPAQIPIEEYFQALSSLAVAHQLRVVRQNPLASRTYPGLLEQRYAYEVIGTMPDLARFFKAIENAEFWADISYLKIEGGQRKSGEPTDERVASLTISLFSAARADSASGNG